MGLTIYGDEAGFTGNNLLDPNQPFFAYATVAADPSHATEVVQRAVRDFRIQAGELKGKRLITSNRGRKAIASVLGPFADSALVQAYHKRYTLATKFFEYVFEPVLAEQNSLFYNCGLHRFISAFIYVEAMTDGEDAVALLRRFQELMTKRDPERVGALFPVAGLQADCSDVLRDIETFAVCHRDTIAADVAAHAGGEPLFRWMLDVSVGALWNQLQMWGERIERLEVICDESNPLVEMRDTFNVMLGRTDRSYLNFEDRLQPLIFNLAKPIEFGSSHDYAGIQVADLFATTAIHVCRDLNSKELAPLKEIVIKSFHNAVFPDIEALNLDTPEAFVSRLVLYELVDRTLKKENLFTAMPDFIAVARAKHSEFLRDSRHASLADG
jgi:hypothetical protein